MNTYDTYELPNEPSLTEKRDVLTFAGCQTFRDKLLYYIFINFKEFNVHTSLKFSDTSN